MDEQELLDQVSRWKKESEDLRLQYDNRWSKNLKLLKGIFSEEENNRSRVRNRSKIFFRKIWATKFRLLSAFYKVFLQDLDTFTIKERGPEDELKARVLQKMTEYRRDFMMNNHNLFLKFIWAMSDIADYGWCVGKLHWYYNPANPLEDWPEFILYPPEQVYPDLFAETKDKMRYVILESYMTKEEMEENGYENIDKAQEVAIPSNVLRNTRYMGNTDPLQNPGLKEYPTPGRYADENRDARVGKRYVVRECFYKKEGRIWICVVSPEAILKQPEPSRYGDNYDNIIFGNCLTEAHKMIGEGFPEPLEGPQESFNTTLNMRKDNLSLALNKMHVVNRFANVDLESLVTSRPGGLVMADDATSAVMPIEHGDVTQSAYVEAQADESQMQEMSGVTDIQMGQAKTDKATVAQINFSTSSAKIDFYAAIVGETFYKPFYKCLATMIQKFETDERAYRVANEALKRELAERNMVMEGSVYDLNFDADCIIRVGYGTVSRELEVRNLMLAWDRAMMSNQAMLGLAQAGVIPPQGLRLFDSTAFAEELLPMIGRKNVQRFFVNVPAPQPQMGGGGVNMGGMAPQIGDGNMTMPDVANELQAGSMGGI